MSMETLPPELKLKILRRVDFSTLKALVHASPAYHALYRSSRLEILTSATLSYLEHLSFDLGTMSQWHMRPDLGGDFDYWYFLVCLPVSNRSKGRLEAAFDSYWKELEQQGIHKRPIKLSLDHCTALLAIEGIMGYVRIDKVTRCSRDLDGDGEDGCFQSWKTQKGLKPCPKKDDCYPEFLKSKSLIKMFQ